MAQITGMVFTLNAKHEQMQIEKYGLGNIDLDQADLRWLSTSTFNLCFLYVHHPEGCNTKQKLFSHKNNVQNNFSQKLPVPRRVLDSINMYSSEEHLLPPYEPAVQT